ncbi:hypothetical protein GCM10017767_10680 [Halomonas urumqiensis]|nr:hypothetical protein GCM10017767_10680 [Halomonas urumqiensis]
MESSRVDWKQYANTTPSTVKDPIGFFLENYDQYPLKVTGWFDSDYYLSEHRDVRQDGANPLVHFLLYGEKEGRRAFSPTEQPINFNQEIQHPKVNEDDACRLRVISKDVVSLGKKLVESTSRDTPRHTSLRKALDSSPVDWSALIQIMGAKDRDDAVSKFIALSNDDLPVLDGFFDPKLYLEFYPDIRAAGVNPLEHYLLHGKSEGRAGWVNIEEFIIEGGACWNPNLKTVVVVTHDATSTGAPVVSLEVAKKLAKSYNIITASLQGGALYDRFVECGVSHFNAPAHYGLGALRHILERLVSIWGIDCVLLSSVESLPFIEAASSIGIPTVTLIHEYSEYTRPVGKMSRAIIASDIVVYPSGSLKKSGLAELYDKTGARNEPNHIYVQPQGYLGFAEKISVDSGWSLLKKLSLEDDSIIIAGAGHVQPRKGVDWFLQTCYYMKKILHKQGDPRANKLQFVWLGGGYEEDDVHVSVWLRTYIKQSGIEKQCHFPGAVHDVRAALMDADIFLLSSRLDPFPNVAVDALNADCALAVFKGASGISDFVKEHDGRFVEAPYGDCYSLAESLVAGLDYLIVRDGINHDICVRHLSFDHYVSEIDSYLRLASRQKEEIEHVIECSQAFKERFDPDFYRLSIGEGDRRRHFLTLLYKGLIYSKPFAGSDAKGAVESRPYKHGESFFNYVEWLMLQEDFSMPLSILNGAECEPYEGRVAIQFHVFYNDLILEYCKYFETLVGHDVDLFVSHVNDLGEHELSMLQDCVSGRLVTDKVENIGRDVHHFHQQFIEHIQDHYDVVGHFHTKKSTDSADGIGDRWRRYLLGNLLGSPQATREVLANFNDQAVGLVFSEDAHCIDEADNGEAIETLLEPLGYSRRPYYHTFPVGTMFWARVQALSDLSRLDSETFKLTEPVPYDGTVLHAFERVLPQLIQETGFKIRRVYTQRTFW